MRLIVGLGNVGLEYIRTRHNLGFMVVDRLVGGDMSNFTANDKFQAMVSEGTLEGEKVLLVKPSTMMNLSGQSIGALANFYKLAPEDVWVVHDDLDLAFGKLRVRQGGGSAGHNGLKSIIDALGENFGRFRLGIANDTLKNPMPSEAFVLSKFSETEQKQLPSAIEQTAEILRKHLGGAELEDTTRNLLESRE